MPFRLSPSQTGTSPTSRVFILPAASLNGALELITSTCLVITSTTCILSLLWKSLFRCWNVQAIYQRLFRCVSMGGRGVGRGKSLGFRHFGRFGTNQKTQVES